MSTRRNTLLIATNNAGKVAELKELAADLPWDLKCLVDFPDAAEVVETGRTFADNARLKASEYAIKTNLFALADDSGLEVAGLGGRPGILSARYGGEETPFPEKMDILLAELRESGTVDRAARFVCSIAISDPNGNILFLAEGVCAGRLAANPQGSGGFGYDPLFIPDGFDQTFGELSNDIKQKISHRFRAFQQIIPFLRHFNVV